MKRKQFKQLFLFLQLMLLTACGSSTDIGSPGSTGSGNTLVKVIIKKAEHLGPAGASELWGIDAFQQTCSNGQPEPFVDDHAQLTVIGEPITQDTTPPGNLTIDRYDVVFYPQDKDSPPVDSYTSTFTATIIPDGKTETVLQVMVFPINRKEKFMDDIQSGRFSPVLPAVYDMVVRFYGKNDYGKEFSFVYQTMISVGNYYYCGG